MTRSIMAVLLLPATVAGAVDVGVLGRKLALSVKTVNATSKLTSLQKDPAVTYGAAGDPALVSATLEVFYADTPANVGTLPMPAPWSGATGVTAKYKNPLAPAPPSPVKSAVVKNAKHAEVVAKSIGGLDLSAPPGPGGVVTVLTVANGNDGQTRRFCTLYSTAAGSTVLHSVRISGPQLKAKDGVPTACPDPCANGVKDHAETDVDCGGGECAACEAGDDCIVHSDCVTGVCTDLVCQPSEPAGRPVDVSFVVDHSGSLGSAYSSVVAAAKAFVDFFDSANDRMALVMFSSDTVVADPINVGGSGFDAGSVKDHLTSSRSVGKTLLAEGLYRGWDELRRVPTDTQAAVRVVVLVTDGAPNMFPGAFRRRPTNVGTGSTFSIQVGGLNVNDFPVVGGTSTSSPGSVGLFPITSACCATLATEPSCITPGGCWTSPSNTGPNFTNGRMPGIPHLPDVSAHPAPQSAGMPTAFPLQTNGLSGQRILLLETTGTTLAGHRYPSHANNIGKAARNLAERIAHEIRSDASGAHPIRIYTVGLGTLLEAETGVQPAETGSSILRRIANDPASPSFNAAQPEGKYYFAADVTQLDAAFVQLRAEIVRLTQ